MTNQGTESKEKGLKSGGIELRQATLVCNACRTRTMTAYGALRKDGKKIKRFVKIEGGAKTIRHGIVCDKCLKGISEERTTERCAQCGTSICGDWYKRMSHVAVKEGAELRFCSNVCEEAFDLFATLRNGTIEQWERLHPKPRHSPIFRTAERPHDQALLSLIHHLDREQTQYLAAELAKAASRATWAISRHTQSGWYPLLGTNTINLTDDITMTLPLPIAALATIQENDLAKRIRNTSSNHNWIAGEITTKDDALQCIIDLGFDHDGYRDPIDLKSLIDELVVLARHGKTLPL
jgi:hypothetical protein